MLNKMFLFSAFLRCFWLNSNSVVFGLKSSLKKRSDPGTNKGPDDLKAIWKWPVEAWYGNLQVDLPIVEFIGNSVKQFTNAGGF